MKPIVPDTNLYCINVGNFLNTWVYNNEDICFLVDPGPSNTTNLLKENLDSLKIGNKDLDYILLTHVHVDHAGGVGKLLNFFPQSKVICHPKGIKHLINPKKLWEGSLKVLGKEAEYYGKIDPVPEDRILSLKTIHNGEIKVVETLGHAPHHQSYIFKYFLFIGEACGHNYPSEKAIFIRPATPPIFDYDIYISSLQKLLKLDLSGFKICFPHFGMRDNAAMIIKIAQDQIKTWLKVINSFYNERNQPKFMEHLFTELLKVDKIYSNLKLLDKEIQLREPFIMRQSIAGIIGYIEKKRKYTS
ncbi:hypothetical protein LCGC14_1436520 [marine sediment metagenome]|uniref:Metallo-beta-lactamase domain-containing protein n=1 Tax=marine sediment metagenome TaxID=412755 RepID=A0A0F9K878_9ZZZZ